MFFFSKMMKIVLLDRYFFASLNEILSGFLQLFRGDVNSFQSFFKSDFAIQSNTVIIKKNRQFAMLCILNKSFDLTEKIDFFEFPKNEQKTCEIATFKINHSIWRKNQVFLKFQKMTKKRVKSKAVDLLLCSIAFSFLKNIQLTVWFWSFDFNKCCTDGFHARLKVVKHHATRTDWILVLVCGDASINNTFEQILKDVGHSFSTQHTM